MWNLTKKITETAQTFNFSDFPLILCGNGPKGTKTTQTQTLFSQIGTFFWGIQGIPSESWRPGLSENVVVFVAIIFWTRIMAGWSWVKFQRKKIVEWNRSKKRHGYNFAFQASILNQHLANRYVLMLIQWQNLKRKIVAVSFFVRFLIFANIAKISDSVDFEQP